MTLRWTRTTLLNPAVPGGRETWRMERAGAAPRAFDVAVDVGKPFDVLGFKGVDLAEIRGYADHLASVAARLYADGAPRRTIAACPCCGADTAGAEVAMTVFGVAYRRCGDCGHVFVREQPSEAALHAVFAESDAHSGAYTDADAAERRIAAIAAPKYAWAADHYAGLHGRRPRSGVDAGAGGGHFVEAMRRNGLAARGFELSHASRAFARAAFGIELEGVDFAAAEPGRVDLATLWGVLEYVPEPCRMLAAARRWLSPADGLLVVEVPRFDALGTRAQTLAGARIARHMDPTSHVNAFTEASLCTALIETGFEPVAAWFFGMDGYETVLQMALRAGDAAIAGTFADFVAALQSVADDGRLCDDLIVAARPV